MLNKILVVSSHIDDGELGCGGTMARFLEEDKEVFHIILSDGQGGWDDKMKVGDKELRDAMNTLGIKKNNWFLYDIENKYFLKHRQKILDILEEKNNEIKPDLVLIPSLKDTHQDHKIVSEECIRAFRNNVNLMCYEEFWNVPYFKPQFFVKLSKRNLDLKLDVLKCYKTQKEKFYFDEEVIRSLARIRGAFIKEKYAESFEIVRLIK